MRKIEFQTRERKNEEENVKKVKAEHFSIFFSISFLLTSVFVDSFDFFKKIYGLNIFHSKRLKNVLENNIVYGRNINGKLFECYCRTVLEFSI